MSENIKEISEDEWKVIGLDGEELENSPYETEKKAKQAFNAHKLSNNSDNSRDEDTEDDSGDDNNDVEDDLLDNDSDKDDKNDDSDSSIMSLLGNKYVILAGLGFLGWKFYNSEDSSRTETVQKEDPEPEDSGRENLDSGRKSASEMFV